MKTSNVGSRIGVGWLALLPPIGILLFSFKFRSIRHTLRVSL